MKNNPLKELARLGQSVWLDDIRRSLLSSGELAALIRDDGLAGLTSNPTIFEKAIAENREYDDDIWNMTLDGKSSEEICETLTIGDLQVAADLFRSVYNATNGTDGYVSLEVAPHLAHNAEGTVQEGRRLWARLGRPNVLIKVPATAAGLPAIEQLLCEGINVNVTLIFGLARYRQVLEAYLTALEARVQQGKSVEKLSSVASFFVSRIDTMVDSLLEERIAAGGSEAHIAQQVHGQVAVASASMAYQTMRHVFRSVRFERLAEKGARPQRLLWASTGTKNPKYSDVKYVETLIGPQTVNTMPPKTLDAYRLRGAPRPRLEEDAENARWVFGRLPVLGISIDRVAEQLEKDGVDNFLKSFGRSIEAVRSVSARHHPRPERTREMTSRP